MSLFGGKKKEEAKPAAVGEDKAEYKEIKTGGEIDTIVVHLLANANDKEEEVRLAISRSLQNIGQQHPEMVLTAIVNFIAKRLKEQKMDPSHHVLLLKILNTILDSTRDSVTQPVAQSLVSFAAREMMLPKIDPKIDWQTPASQVIVTLAVPYANICIDEMLRLFPPGKVPEYNVMKTLADIAAANGVMLTIRLKEILGRCIPVLGAVQKEAMRWAFAAALGRFAEAVGHFNSNAADQYKAQITDDMFRSDMNAAFDVIFNNWFNSKETKARLVVCEALGYMCPRIPKPSFELLLPKLIPAYLATLKKEKPSDHQPISQGLCAILETAVEAKSPQLDLLVPQILPVIHPLVCRPPDYKTPSTVKCYNELLRCFEILSRQHLEGVLTFLVNRFPTKEIVPIVGSLSVLRHLVNAMDAELADRKPYVLSSVQALVIENDLRIRKAMLQLVVGMANQGYLSLQGSSVLVKYVCQQAAIPDSAVDKFEASRKKGAPEDPDAVSPGQIRSAANHILNVMSTKVPSSHPVLWPYLLELISDENYSSAVTIVSQCIASILEYKAGAGETVKINFEENVNLPSPQTIMSRLMILANVPHKKKGLGEAVLNCMGAIAPVLHPSIGKYWEETVPALREHLQAHSEEELNLSKWQDTLLKMWRETLNVVGQGAWLRDLAKALTGQYKLYPGDSALLRVIHRFMGALLATVDSKEIIVSKIDLLLTTVNHKSEQERQGVAQAMGLAASAHLDMVLPKLTEFLEKTKKPKQTGFFASFGSTKGSKEEDLQKATVVLCYGYVTAYGDPILVPARLEAHVLNNILPVIAEATDPILKENIIKSIDLIGKAIHQSRLPADSKFVLKPRDALITGLLRFLGAKPKNLKPDQKPVIQVPTNQLRVLALNAISTLVSLSPPISADMRKDILDVVLPCFELTEEVAPAPAVKGGKRESVSEPSSRPSTAAPSPTAASPEPAADKPAADGEEKKGDDENGESKEDAEEEEEEEAAPGTVVDLVVANLNSLLSSIVQMDPAVVTVTNLITRLERSLVSKKEIERERACASYLVVLKKFVSKIVAEGCQPPEKELAFLGHYIAILAPRCGDPRLPVRTTAVENIQALLYVDQLLRAPGETKPSAQVKLITEIRGRIESSVLEERLVAVRDLSVLVCSLISSSEYTELLTSLLSTLSDSEQDACLAAAELQKAALEKRAAELVPNLPTMLNGLISALRPLSGVVQSAALRSMRVLFQAHFEPAMDVMLTQTMPLNNEVSAAFKALADSDAGDLGPRTLQKLITVINMTALLEDKPTPKVMVATSALEKVLTLESVKSLVMSAQYYTPILGTLIMRVGTAHGVDDGTSSSDAVKGLKAFFKFTDSIYSALDGAGVWSGLEAKKYDEGVNKLIRVLFETSDDLEIKTALTKFLSEYMNLPYYTGQRCASTSVVSQLVLHCGAPGSEQSRLCTPLLRDLVRLLLPRCVDGKDVIRKQALRGLGNLEAVWSDDIALSYASSVLSALTSASEDQHPTVAAEAVASLTRVARVVPEATILPMLINICYRMRPAFDRKEAEIRKAAFNLFGELCRFGASQPADFMEQVHQNMTICIVHINDDDDEVREACLGCFRRVCKLANADMARIAAEYDGESSGYDTFVSELAPPLVANFGPRLSAYLDQAVNYFKSTWQVLRANSSVFVANVLAATTAEHRQRINVSSICASLTKLLKEDNATTRTKTAKALALLYQL